MRERKARARRARRCRRGGRSGDSAVGAGGRRRRAGGECGEAKRERREGWRGRERRAQQLSDRAAFAGDELVVDAGGGGGAEFDAVGGEGIVAHGAERGEVAEDEEDDEEDGGDDEDGEEGKEADEFSLHLVEPAENLVFLAVLLGAGVGGLVEAALVVGVGVVEGRDGLGVLGAGRGALSAEAAGGDGAGDVEPVVPLGGAEEGAVFVEAPVVGFAEFPGLVGGGRAVDPSPVARLVGAVLEVADVGRGALGEEHVADEGLLGGGADGGEGAAVAAAEVLAADERGLGVGEFEAARAGARAVPAARAGRVVRGGAAAPADVLAVGAAEVGVAAAAPGPGVVALGGGEAAGALEEAVGGNRRVVLVLGRVGRDVGGEGGRVVPVLRAEVEGVVDLPVAVRPVVVVVLVVEALVVIARGRVEVVAGDVVGRVGLAAVAADAGDRVVDGAARVDPAGEVGRGEDEAVLLDAPVVGLARRPILVPERDAAAVDPAPVPALVAAGLEPPDVGRAVADHALQVRLLLLAPDARERPAERLADALLALDKRVELRRDVEAGVVRGPRERRRAVPGRGHVGQRVVVVARAARAAGVARLAAELGKAAAAVRPGVVLRVGALQLGRRRLVRRERGRPEPVPRADVRLRVVVAAVVDARRVVVVVRVQVSLGRQVRRARAPALPAQTPRPALDRARGVAPALREPRRQEHPAVLVRAPLVRLPWVPVRVVPVPAVHPPPVPALVRPALEQPDVHPTHPLARHQRLDRLLLARAPDRRQRPAEPRAHLLLTLHERRRPLRNLEAPFAGPPRRARRPGHRRDRQRQQRDHHHAPRPLFPPDP
mmetsp:Transcript_8880/g.28183  ORF Transcript_8880/g.28183 Transcript_8880/m.28183 type:complete len:831 (+) Transcript_8880:231-2723(+)